MACGKKLPDQALVCVFCKARQREEERLDPTPVKGIQVGASPAEAVAAIEREQRAGALPARVSAAAALPQSEPAPAPRRERGTIPERPSAKRGGDGVGGAEARTRSPRAEPSVLSRLSSWNRNERASLAAAGLALLGTVLLYDRSGLSILAAVGLTLSGLMPLPRTVRGALALVAGVVPLWRLSGLLVTLALALLPGALLIRAKNPTSRLARLVAVAGVAVVVVAYLVPHEGVAPARAILSNFKGDVAFENVVRAAYLVLPALLCVLGLLAVAPSRTSGGAVLWATLALLWLPLGLLLGGWWAHAFGAGLAGAVSTLACAMGAALGIADLAGGDDTTIQM